MLKPPTIKVMEIVVQRKSNTGTVTLLLIHLLNLLD